jgi:energy-coupling factor transport system substrate-specific component
MPFMGEGEPRRAMNSLNVSGRRPAPQTVLTVLTTCIAINIVLGFIVRRLELPIYLDTVGTFAMVILVGWRWGLLGALVAVLIGSLLIFPFYFYYSLTAVAIVLVVETCRRWNLFRTAWSTIGAGLIVAVTAALVSAPVTAFLFGGVTATGNDAITALFVSIGNTLVKSVFLSGFSSEPIDKVISALVAYGALRGLSQSLTVRFGLRPVSD